MTRSRAVRSLRRRLWRALQEEDVNTAIRAYTATRADYEAWLREEELRREEERQREEEARLVRQKEKRATQHVSLKYLGFLRFRRSTCNIPAQSKQQSKRDSVASVQTLEEPMATEGDYPLLQKEMSPSDAFVADDFLSPHDSYEQNQSATEQQTDPGEVELFTTPLHEAARLGSGKLVRLFLEHGGRPNVRNGKQRTALHMAAGGLTGQEEGLVLARLNAMQPKADTEVIGHDVGIRAQCMDTPESKHETGKYSGEAKKAAVPSRRLVKLGSHDSGKDHEAMEQKKTLPPIDVTPQRMDAFLAIMAWCHPEDGSPSSGEGPSINSVDGRGRTSLHYAAELGRSDICMAIVSSFGAILTVVDESSRTPCELADERSYHDLAAQLEARALLYVDPSGMEDELLASILADERDNGDISRKQLAPPFSWFKTLNSDAIRQQRNEIIETATVKMLEILNSRQMQKEANKVTFNYNVSDSLDSVPQGDIGVVASIGKPIQDNERVSDGLATGALVEDTVDRPPTPPTCVPVESSHGNDNAATNLATGGLESSPAESSNRNENPGVKLDSSASEYTFILESLQESHVERFLAFHGWRMEHAVAEFRKDPTKALDDAGVPIVMHMSLGKSKEVMTQKCLICCDEFAPDAPKWRELRSCNHGFCVQCLGDYIADCARSKAGGITVICPHHECAAPLTQNELQRLAPALWESLQDAADENFVATSKDLKFCPHPGCTGVVQRLVPDFLAEVGFNYDIIDISGAVCVMVPGGGEEDKDAPLTYEGVRDKRYVLSKGSTQPHMAHRFCFACGAKSGHWPVSCEELEKWQTKIREEVADEDEGENAGNYQDVAQRLWMKTNTRPCPQCKIPIEKNEGCNHMTCSNRHCRYEFCWICRKDWKLHNTATGGFYRCNRWQGDESHEYYDKPPPPQPSREGDAAETAEQNGYGTAIHSTLVAVKRANEMNRFLHHFRRWSAHSISTALEQNMANTVCSRLAPVVDAAIDFSRLSKFNFGGKGLSFVHAAFTELLECRSNLQHSYVFAFFRYPTLYDIRRNRAWTMRRSEMATFEHVQSELEMITEQMSDLVARRHLRATQTQIMSLTREAAEKRSNLSSFLIQILDGDRKEERENDSQSRSIPPPIDIGGMLARAPMRNEHEDMDRADNGGSTSTESEEEAAMEEAQQASLLSFIVAREEEAALQQAQQASLRSLIAESESYETGGDTEEAAGSFAEWSCEACTYLNLRGRTCAMCGTAM